MSVYGYARVSSKDQNESWQIDALKKFGAEKIFIDKLSGKDFNRRQCKMDCVRRKAQSIF